MPPSLTMPLSLSARGSLAALLQDTPLEVGQSLALLLATTPGERRCEPGYGTPQGLGARFSTLSASAAITAWEPRAQGAQLSHQGAGTGTEAITVAVDRLEVA